MINGFRITFWIQIDFIYRIHLCNTPCPIAEWWHDDAGGVLDLFGADFFRLPSWNCLCCLCHHQVIIHSLVNIISLAYFCILHPQFNFCTCATYILPTNSLNYLQKRVQLFYFELFFFNTENDIENLSPTRFDLHHPMLIFKFLNQI